MHGFWLFCMIVAGWYTIGDWRILHEWQKEVREKVAGEASETDGEEYREEKKEGCFISPTRGLFWLHCHNMQSRLYLVFETLKFLISFDLLLQEPMQKNNNNSTRAEDGKEDLTELTKSLKVMKSFIDTRLFSLWRIGHWVGSCCLLFVVFAEQDKGVKKAEEDARES